MGHGVLYGQTRLGELAEAGERCGAGKEKSVCVPERISGVVRALTLM